MSDTGNELGPLAVLVGTWEGQKGADAAPDDDRVSTEQNAYRERMTFAPTGEVANHEQKLHGLRYATTAWRLGADDPFHEELGYWLWDGAENQVLRCFMVPRGVTILAGGTAAPDAKSFELHAEAGSDTLGICSNPFLDREFKTVRYQLKFEVRGPDTIHYWEDTVLRIKGRDDLFHHTDENTLNRVG
jgi:hypothetical protein